MELGVAPNERPVRGFSIGMAALLEDLGVVDAARGWAGSAGDLVRAARLKQALALGQARAGQFEDACRGIEGVVRIHRRLAEPAPARHQPELAVALTAWGLWSSRLARREQAAALLSDAVDLYRRLLDQHRWPKVMRGIQLRAGLSVALSNLAIVRSELGEHAAAVAAGRESVELLRQLYARNPVYRMLVRGNPVGFEHCLAAALNNFGLVLAAAGHLTRAFELAERTVESYRRLAGLAPVVFESELARALHNLALAAAEVGRLDTALTASQEAVHLHRFLAPADQVGHRQRLCQALCGYARIRAACGRDLDGAVGAAEEAVGLAERLAADRPGTFTPDLHAAYRSASLARTTRGRRTGNDRPDRSH